MRVIYVENLQKAARIKEDTVKSSIDKLNMSFPRSKKIGSSLSVFKESRMSNMMDFQMIGSKIDFQ